jgi:hypothetical protein
MTRILRTGNGNRAPWLGEGLRPTLRDEIAKDGAPGLFVAGWGETTAERVKIGGGASGMFG